jgi:hypothetical protein
VKALNIIEELSEEIQSEDIQRLALRLMENALTLSGMDAPIATNASASMAHFGQVDHFAGSH